MKVHMVAAINAALKQEMQKDPSVMCLGEDIGVNGGVFRVTDKLQEEFGKDRVVDTPLAEAGIVGASIGLALGGMKPIPEIQFSGFNNSSNVFLNSLWWRCQKERFQKDHESVRYRRSRR